MNPKSSEPSGAKSQGGGPESPGSQEESETPFDPEIDRARKYRSIFELTQVHPNQADQKSFPPEAFGSVTEMQPEDFAKELENTSSWDIATHYHELIRKLRSRHVTRSLAQQLREMSAQAILAKAKEVLGSAVRPVAHHVSSWSDIPPKAEQVELDLDETLENSPVGLSAILEGTENPDPLTAQDIWMTYTLHRVQPIILTVDTSLSMTGEKLALTAVALSVVLLEFPEDPIGIIAFENEAKILKRPDESITVQALIERFLDVPAQGYTHLEDGMRAALNLVGRAAQVSRGRPPSTVLLTDGKYTAGRDPTYLASKFTHLVVLKMGSDRASLGICQDLAKGGRGTLKEVGELEALPSVMYSVVKDILRGR